MSISPVLKAAVILVGTVMLAACTTSPTPHPTSSGRTAQSQNATEAAIGKPLFDAATDSALGSHITQSMRDDGTMVHFYARPIAVVHNGPGFSVAAAPFWQYDFALTALAVDASGLVTQVGYGRVSAKDLSCFGYKNGAFTYCSEPEALKSDISALDAAVSLAPQPAALLQ